MASTVWKGHLTFGLVSIPVRLIRAARAQRVPLRQLYRPRETSAPTFSESSVADKPKSVAASLEFKGSSLNREFHSQLAPDISPTVIPVKRVYQPANDAPTNGRPVNGEGESSPIQSAELVKGFESEKGQYVLLDEEELRQITPKTSTEMEIVEFVQFNEIDPIYLETSYYVVPEDTGEKAYALLFEAMRGEGRAAIAHVSMHRRDHVMIVRAGKTGLIAHTMFYADEVRTVEEFRTDTGLASVKEVELARTLVQALTKPFQPDQFKNQFRERLNQLIASRAAEHQLTPAEAPKSGKVIDIMDALRRSLAGVKSVKQPEQAPSAQTQRKPARAQEQAGDKQSKRRGNKKPA
jgi:DNA end-binding protein Ku